MLEPPLVVDTVRLPVPVMQLTEYATVAVPPAGTLTVCGFGLLTVQFAATPDRATLWLPAGIPAKVALPLVGADWFDVPSSVTPYPSGSMLETEVAALAVKPAAAGPAGRTP